MVGGEKRGALVEAAFARIASGGLEGLRLRQVADDVGIDHSTLHHHVATKQELILAVAAHATRQLWSDAWERPDPAEALSTHFTEISTLMRERPALFVVNAELALRAARDPAVDQALAELQSGWRIRLVDLLRRGLADGTWRGLDPEVTADIVIATARGLVHTPSRARTVLGGLESLLNRGGERCTS